MISNKMRTAECITPSHPDKICDRISDAILDECLRQDPDSRVAVETMGGHGKIYIAGEITTNAKLNIDQIVKKIYKQPIVIETNLVKQSNFIAQGVDTGGAGDQGIMVGYACNENDEFVPHEFYLARQLCRKIYDLYPYDGKTQVTLEGNKIKVVVTSFQNTPAGELKRIVREWLHSHDGQDAEVHCNPAGDWDVGGFDADTGLTGRKLAVDNYGPRVPVGGGAFSGKDPSKVDRSAAYMARLIAVDILTTTNAKEVYVYLAYAIGYDKPVHATAIADGEEIQLASTTSPFSPKQMWRSDLSRGMQIRAYDLSPRGIIKRLKLKSPFYEKTAQWGHFGNGYNWG